MPAHPALPPQGVEKGHASACFLHWLPTPLALAARISSWEGKEAGKVERTSSVKKGAGEGWKKPRRKQFRGLKKGPRRGPRPSNCCKLDPACTQVVRAKYLARTDRGVRARTARAWHRAHLQTCSGWCAPQVCLELGHYMCHFKKILSLLESRFWTSHWSQKLPLRSREWPRFKMPQKFSFWCRCFFKELGKDRKVIQQYHFMYSVFCSLNMCKINWC